MNENRGLHRVRGEKKAENHVNDEVETLKDDDSSRRAMF